MTTTLGIYAGAPTDYFDRAASGFVVDPLSVEPTDNGGDEEDPSGGGAVTCVSGSRGAEPRRSM